MEVDYTDNSLLDDLKELFASQSHLTKEISPVIHPLVCFLNKGHLNI